MVRTVIEEDSGDFGHDDADHREGKEIAGDEDNRDGKDIVGDVWRVSSLDKKIYRAECFFLIE